MWKQADARRAIACVGISIFLMNGALAQETSLRKFGGLHFDTAVQALRTEAEKEAIGFVFDLFKNPEEVFWTNCRPEEIGSGRCNHGRSHGWLFDLAPDVRVNTGNEDAFQSIVAKISGNFMVFSLQSLGPDASPVPLPDARKLMHVFPISAGIETTADGDTLNAVAEIGYVPFKFGGGRLSAKTISGLGSIRASASSSRAARRSGKRRGMRPAVAATTAPSRKAKPSGA